METLAKRSHSSRFSFLIVWKCWRVNVSTVLFALVILRCSFLLSVLYISAAVTQLDT